MANKQNQRTRKRKNLLIAGKLLASGYLIVFTAGYITSSTGAYFIDVDKEAHVIQAGTWWDGSELVFTGKPAKSSGEQCPKEAVTIKLHNNGQAMIGSTDYQVYYSKEGDPRKGKVIKEGKVDSLQAGETTTLSYENADEGSYIFKVMQRPGYDDNNDEPGNLWSEKVTIACANTDEQVKEDKKNEEGKNKQEAQNKQESNNTSDAKQGESDSDKQIADQKQQEVVSKEKTEDSANGDSKTAAPDEKETKQDTQVKQDKETSTQVEEEMKTKSETSTNEETETNQETSTSDEMETKTSDNPNDSQTDTQSATKKQTAQ